MLYLCLLACLLDLALGQSTPCGVPTVQPKTKRIVGGTAAVQGSWPWMVLFVDDLGYITGSGSIIGSRTILTSAQLFQGPGYGLADTDLSMWVLYMGSHNINLVADNERNYTIKNVVIHENYNFTSLENDVALVFPDMDIVYNDHTSPVCLPDPGHQYHVGDVCYLAGWGATHGGNEEVLNQVDLPILDDNTCQQHWQDFLPSTELCAGYENMHKDFCADDIGSPLACKASTGAWYAQGIASSGGDCSLADEPGIFEDVSKYSQWIKRTMEANGFPYEY